MCGVSELQMFCNNISLDPESDALEMEALRSFWVRDFPSQLKRPPCPALYNKGIHTRTQIDV
jgi:hypothetical protein